MPKVANCDTVRNVQCVSLGHRPVTPGGPIWTISPANYPMTPDTQKPRDKPEELYKIGVENPAFFDSESQQHLPHHLRPLKTVPSDTSPQVRLKKRSWIRWCKLRFQKTEKNYRGRCPAGLVLALLLLLVILVIGIAVALYLTVGGGLQPYTYETEEEGSWAVEGEFRITNRAYTTDMTDSRTSAFGTLASEVVRSIDEVFFQSALVRDYNGSEIMSFREGSVVVNCRIYLNRPFVNAAQQVGMAFVRGLEEGHGTLPAGNLQVDIHSIAFSVLPGVYPPPKSTTEVPIPDASWSQWSGWSSCLDESGHCDSREVQSRFRDCRTENGVGDALPNANACWKLGGTRNQVRDCVCGNEPPRNPVTSTTRSRTSSTSTTTVSSTTTTTTTVATQTKKESPSASDNDDDGIFSRRRGHGGNSGGGNPGPTRNTGTTGYRLNPILTTTRVPNLEVPTTTTRPSQQGGWNSSPSSVTTVPSWTEGMVSPSAAAASSGTQNEFEPTKSPSNQDHGPVSLASSTVAPTDATTPVSSCSDCSSEAICLLQSGASMPSCVLPKDSADPRGCGGWCSNANDLCRKVDETMVQCVDGSECVFDEWRCGNGLCIPEARRCDGHVNCYDHTDELNCKCKPGEIHCGKIAGQQTSCLPADRRCNGDVDCWDGFDEVNCTNLCPETQSTCNNGQCISKELFCDGFIDCTDRSDEPQGCDGPCSTDQFQCHNRRCIPKTAVCDGVDNCSDGSDENVCGRTPAADTYSSESTPKRITRRETLTTEPTTIAEKTWLPVWKET